MNKTSIEWTDYTVNPVRFLPHGADRSTTMCVKVSPGCKNCYAESITRRFWPKNVAPFQGYTVPGLALGDFVLSDTALESLLKHKKPCKLFWGDMTDLFQDAVKDEWLDKCFAVMALTPHITHQVLTKRPERMLEYLSDNNRFQRIHESVKGIMGYDNPKRPAINPDSLPLPNVWLGVSCEDQQTADKRIPLLLQTPAAVRFISAEPLLASLNIDTYLNPGRIRQLASPALNTHGQTGSDRHQAPGCDAPANAEAAAKEDGITRQGAELAGVEVGIDWVIVGGESGPGARPMHPDWARGLRDQCVAAGVPFFFKQWGEWLGEMQDGSSEGRHINASDEPVRVGKKKAGALLDGREWRQFPGGVA